jgi:hypothetical protein
MRFSFRCAKEHGYILSIGGTRILKASLYLPGILKIDSVEMNVHGDYYYLHTCSGLRLLASADLYGDNGKQV